MVRDVPEHNGGGAFSLLREVGSLVGGPNPPHAVGGTARRLVLILPLKGEAFVAIIGEGFLTYA